MSEFVRMAPRLSPIKPGESNFAFSPLALHEILSLVVAGSSGPTLQQLLSFLGAQSVHDVHTRSSNLGILNSTTGEPQISLSNALWIQSGLCLSPVFQSVVQKVYNASSFEVDFVHTQGSEIASEVNSWVEKNTNGLIKEIMSMNSIEKDTTLLLVNALYFRGNWPEGYFRVSNTREENFHLLDGNSVKVPLMRSRLPDHYIGFYDEFKVLRLPYMPGYSDRCRFAMYIFLPDEKDGLPMLMEKVVSDPDFITHHLPTSPVDVDNVSIPKFKFSFDFEASKALQEDGLSLIFQPGGLSEMVEESQELCVSKILHKCFVEVDEKGTQAAAVCMECIPTCAPKYEYPPKVDFVADHPFMFLIRENVTGTVLFFGHVLNPLQ